MLEQLIAFAEQGNQHKIICSTPSGKPSEYQGWIMEITEDALLISTGFGDKSGKDVWIQFEQLKNAQFYYWNHQQGEWQAFTIQN
ncbi:MAG: hypothetical protein Q4D05_06720 [Acinetobacter sp.]|nr:hypothetical protein [Acinetobacter sp.]